jgi:hypothetical protein
MAEETVQELMHIQHKGHQGFKQRATMGFYIMSMLTKKLEGIYNISSKSGEGTVISFKFPEIN